MLSHMVRDGRSCWRNIGASFDYGWRLTCKTWPTEAVPLHVFPLAALPGCFILITVSLLSSTRRFASVLTIAHMVDANTGLGYALHPSNSWTGSSD